MDAADFFGGLGQGYNEATSLHGSTFSTNGDRETGIVVGHTLGLIQGALESIGGGGAALTGAGVDVAGVGVSATGVGAVAGVPAVAAGTTLVAGGGALVVHGALVGGNSLADLAADAHAISSSMSESPAGKTAEETKLGGSHGELTKDKGDGMDSHHMPAKAAIKDAGLDLSPTEAPAVKMEPADHKLTASNGNTPEAEAYRAKQAELIKQGKFNEAQEMDVKDLQSKFGDKYNKGTQQTQDYTKTIPKEKLQPKQSTTTTDSP